MLSSTYLHLRPSSLNAPKSTTKKACRKAGQRGDEHDLHNVQNGSLWPVTKYDELRNVRNRRCH
jgi:hypothetical protein